MSNEIIIRLRDVAYAEGFCASGIRPEMVKHGLDWKKFVITGYSESELYAAFGRGHAVVTAAIEYVKGANRG